MGLAVGEPLQGLDTFYVLVPGFELARTLGEITLRVFTLKGFGGWRTLAGLGRFFVCWSQGSRKLEPWADICQRLRRIFKLNQY